VVEIKNIKLRKLRDILEENKHFIADRRVDFMNIDVEGEEMSVLASNDWGKCVPGFIAIEIHNFDLARITEFEVHNYLTDKGYLLVAKTQLTAIYKHSQYEL